MMRSLSIGIVALALIGCQQPVPGPDPFFPHTRVPSPPTGAAGMSMGAAPPGYLYPAPQPGTGAPGWPTGVSATPAGMPAAPGYPATSPGGYPLGPTPGAPTYPAAPVYPNQPPAWGSPGASSLPSGFHPYAAPANVATTPPAPGGSLAASTAPVGAATPGDAVRIAEPTPARPLGGFAGGPVAPITSLAASTTSPTTFATRPMAADANVAVPGRQPVVRTLPNRPADAVSRSTFGQTAPAPLTPAPTAAPATTTRPRTDLTDLPDATRSGDPGWRQPTGSDLRWSSPSGVARAGETSAPTLPAAAPTTLAGVQPASYKVDASYGYDTNYAWLRGQLEYVATLRAWRVQYIPNFGQPDRFGGSLVVANPQALAGLARGELVEVRGRVAQQWSRGEMATVYQVTEAKRVGTPAQ